MKIVPFEMRHMGEWEALERACFSDPWTRGMMESGLRDSITVNLALEDEAGVLTGYACMYHVAGEGCISNIAVSPEAQGRGYGGLLLDAMMARAVGLKLEFLTLEVRTSNEAAIGLYESRGFSPVGTRREYYERPREDALMMTKML